MTRRAQILTGWILLLALAPGARARAQVVPISPGVGYVTGVDAGVGPGWLPVTSPSFKSVTAANEFQAATLGANSATIDFGTTFAGLQPTANNVWSQTVNTQGFVGLRTMTQGIAYVTPPAPYQYGIASTTNAIASNADIGYGIAGANRYEFVPVLNTGTATFTLHSDTAFQDFGFYLTGLGNEGGVVDLTINGKAIPEISLTGSSEGGVLYLGYLGNTAIHDLGIVMNNVTGPTRDIFAISDIQLIQPFAAIPEPSCLALIGVGITVLVGSAVIRGRRPPCG